MHPRLGTEAALAAGRDVEIDAFDLLVAKAARRNYDRGMMLTGLRGVGKTALLNSLRADAERHDWFKWAADIPDITRIELYVEPFNDPSSRAAESAGYHREGLLQRWQVVAGEPWDMYMYAKIP